MRSNVQGVLMLAGAVAFFVAVIVFFVIPVWSECLSKNSLFFCMAALGGK